MTSKTKARDSETVAELREELAAMTRDLRAIRTRALALSRRLKRAAQTGEIIGRAGSKPYTVEDWCADSLKGLVHDFSLDEAIREFASEARSDYRDMARFHLMKTLGGTLIDAGAGEDASAT